MVNYSQLIIRLIKYDYVLVPGMRYFKTTHVQEGAVAMETQDHLHAPGHSESLSGVTEPQEVADPLDQSLALKSTAFLSAIVAAAQHTSDFQTDIVADDEHSRVHSTPPVTSELMQAATEPDPEAVGLLASKWMNAKQVAEIERETGAYYGLLLTVIIELGSSIVQV